MTDPRLRRVVLVGFMGAGKTSVGRVVADALGWRFVDFDEVIEAEAGVDVAEIFRRWGEPHFRALEERVGHRLLQQDEVVLGTGGGWAAREGRLTDLPPGTASFWLRVSATTAVERATGQPGRRPLIAGEDPIGRAARLLSERADAYGRARWAVDTEGSTVDDVSARILEILASEYPGIAG